MNFERLQDIYNQKEYTILPVKVGMQLEIHEQVGEGDNKRTWKFKCLVIKVHKPQHPDGTFTVRGKVAGVVVEKIYPLSYPKFEKVILLDEFKIRKSKLYYIRDKIGKAAKMKSNIDQADKNSNLLDRIAKPTPVEKKVDEAEPTTPSTNENNTHNDTDTANEENKANN